MGTTFRIVLYADEAGVARQAADAAFARVDQLNDIFSDYVAESELRRLTAGPIDAPIRVSAELFEVLEIAQEISFLTGGAFDITVGPLTRLWRRAVRQRELPSSDRLSDALARVGYGSLVLDPVARTAWPKKPDMRLDAGGVAKGFTLDEVLDVLLDHGIARALVDGGGDIAASGPPPARTGWRVEVDRGSDRDRRFVNLRHGAVATSGDAYRFVEIDGTRYSHIVDPRTGMGLTTRSSVTVVGPDGARADALASAVSVLGRLAGGLGERTVFDLRGYEGQVVLEKPDHVPLRTGGFAGTLIDLRTPWWIRDCTPFYRNHSE